MIRHTVVFRLKNAKGSAEEKAFLAAADVLARVPGVQEFEKLRQVSPKNEFAFGFSMEFADAAAYRGYNDTRASCRSAGCPRSRNFWRSTTSGCERTAGSLVRPRVGRRSGGRRP